MDKISIEGLSVDAIIGVHEHEKKNRQPVVVDIDLYTNITSAAATDDLPDTVSYGDVARLVTDFVDRSHFNLIETLAEQLAGLILTGFPAVAKLSIRVSKPDAVANARNVSVTIERSQP